MTTYADTNPLHVAIAGGGAGDDDGLAQSRRRPRADHAARARPRVPLPADGGRRAVLDRARQAHRAGGRRLRRAPRPRRARLGRARGASLPLYELALQTANRANDMNATVDISIVSPETAPLALLGSGISDGLSSMLRHAGIAFAAQQADVVAAAIAWHAGAAVEPRPLQPSVRGALMTGRGTRFLDARLGDDGAYSSTITKVCPWDFPAKIAALHLGPYLADGERYAIRA